MKDYYEILQVSQKADITVINTAYRRLALIYHPDHDNANNNEQASMQELNEAYEILKNPIERMKYDNALRKMKENEPWKSNNQKAVYIGGKKYELLYENELVATKINEWMNDDDSSGKMFVDSDALHFVVTKINWMRFRIFDIFLDNFKVSVKTKFVKSDGIDSSTGIIFRESYVNEAYSYYYFSITKNGFYNLSVWVKDKWIDLSGDLVYSNKINKNESNELSVEAIGGNIVLGINGTKIANMKDNRLKYGRIGLAGGTKSGSSFAELSYSDLKIYAITDIE